MASKAKVERIAQIFSTLKENLKEPKLEAGERRKLLEELKVFGRDKNGSEQIYQKDAFSVLCEYAFNANKDAPEAAREALRCIANSLLLAEETRQIFLDLDFVNKAAALLENDSVEEEFLSSRILMLVTYNEKSRPAYKKLLEGEDYPVYLQQALARHAKRISRGNPSTQMETMALVETTKVIYNLSCHHPEERKNIQNCVNEIFDILCASPLAPFPLVPPVLNLINSLINFEITTENLSPNPLAVAAKVVELLDKSTDKPEYLELYANPDFDSNGSQLLILVKRLCETNSTEVRKYLEDKLLPKPEEREKAIGTGDGLCHRLLRFSTSGNSVNTRELILSMFFDISNRDPERLVENIGYGYASGFLFTNNIPVPESASRAQGSRSTGGLDVNPITGQTWEAEERENPVDPFAGMTDEEKEREAERLFVLFERLKKTGVVDVTNPVEQAIKEGRYGDIPVKEDKDSDDE